MNESNPPPSTQGANPPPPQFGAIQKLINQQTAELSRALPKHMSAERLVRIALTCCRTTPKLLECTKESFLGALFTSAQLGIEPVAGRAYILPFVNRRKVDNRWYSVLEAQFILGYPGIMELFFRHDKSLMLSWAEVHERDEFDYQFGTDSFLIHRPAKSGDRGAVTHYWVMATLQGNAKPFWVMSREECLNHGKQHSKTYDKEKSRFYDSSPWVTSEDAMCLKTVFMQLRKLLPLSIELQRALGADESSRAIVRGVENVLDIPSSTDWSLPENAEAAPGPMPEKEPEREKEKVPAKQKPVEKPTESKAAAPAQEKTPMSPVNHKRTDLSAAVATIKENARCLGISSQVLDAAFSKAAKAESVGPWASVAPEILLSAAKTKGWNKMLTICDEVAAGLANPEPAYDDQAGDPDDTEEQDNLFT